MYTVTRTRALATYTRVSLRHSGHNKCIIISNFVVPPNPRQPSAVSPPFPSHSLYRPLFRSSPARARRAAPSLNDKGKEERRSFDCRLSVWSPGRAGPGRRFAVCGGRSGGGDHGTERNGDCYEAQKNADSFGLFSAAAANGF